MLHFLCCVLVMIVRSSDSDETRASCAWYDESEAASSCCGTVDSYHSAAGDLEMFLEEFSEVDNVTALLRNHAVTPSVGASESLKIASRVLFKMDGANRWRRMKIA